MTTHSQNSFTRCLLLMVALLLLAAAWAPVAARVADVPVVATAPLPDAVPPRTRLSRLAL